MKTHPAIENMDIGQNKVYTAKEISEMTGLSTATISLIYNDDPRATVSKQTKEYVKQVLSACNYDSEKAKRVRPVHAETSAERMMELRALGYTNIQIAKICGVDHQTVLKRIGIQPEEFTMESMRIRGIEKKLREEARRNNAGFFKKKREMEEDYKRKVVEYRKAIEEKNSFEVEKWQKKVALEQAREAYNKATKDWDAAREKVDQQSEKIIEFRKEAKEAGELIGVKFA